MLIKLLLFVIATSFFLSLPALTGDSVSAQERTPRELLTQTTSIDAKEVDIRTVILKDYFAKNKSPLEPYAPDFIEAADTYNLDWKLVAAISGVESTFGKKIPGGQDPKYTSYNGWGWGVYGTQSLKFQSWRHGIFTVSEGLRKNYVDKGLTTPAAMNKKYAASTSWGWKVQFFMDDMEKFAQAYPEYNQRNTEQVSVDTLTPQIAARSGKLALSN